MDESATPESDVVVVKNESARRYELHLAGARVGLADYVVRTEPDQAVVITHTETSPAFQGRGLAGQLVRFALEDIAAAGAKVVPACPYVAAYIRRHPEYASLLA